MSAKVGFPKYDKVQERAANISLNSDSFRDQLPNCRETPHSGYANREQDYF